MRVIQSEKFAYRNNRKSECEVSVVIATYNSSLSKLTATLNSVYKQNNIKTEIIISDDGSMNNYLDEGIKFLEERGFYDYIGIINDENIGTVNNYYNAIKLANGKYIKLISPGDELCQDILRDWIDFVETNNKMWSFGDAFFYKTEDDMNKEFLSQSCNPQIINCYNANKEKLCRWNYIVLCDIVLGSATICQREIMMHYFSLITNKVIYAEDNIYRMMMFDDIVPCYYSKEVVFYEYGTGISTIRNSKWEERLCKDWKASDEIMFADKKLDAFQKRMHKAYLLNKRNRRLISYIYMFLNGKFLYYIKKHLFPRLSRINY